LCGASGGIIDPQSPEALRDLMMRRQQDASGRPQTLGEWFWSIFDTCLFHPYSTLNALSAIFAIVIISVVHIIPPFPTDPDQPSGRESFLAFVFVLAFVKLIF